MIKFTFSSMLPTSKAYLFSCYNLNLEGEGVLASTEKCWKVQSLRFFDKTSSLSDPVQTWQMDLSSNPLTRPRPLRIVTVTLHLPVYRSRALLFRWWFAGRYHTTADLVITCRKCWLIGASLYAAGLVAGTPTSYRHLRWVITTQY